MFLKKLIIPLFAVVTVQPCQADTIPDDLHRKELAAARRSDLFNHMDVGITAGVTGLGLEISMPMTRWARVRTGFTYMPRFRVSGNFGVDFDKTRTNTDTPEDYEDKIRRMKDLMSSMSGFKIEDNIDMIMEPTFGNFKFLVDIVPFRNKHWNFTAGFYVGRPRLGKTYNATEDAPTLLAVGMYNNFYMKSYTGDPMISYEDYMGNIQEVNLPPSFTDKFAAMGMMGMPLGQFKDGDMAMMVPDENGVAKAEMVVRKFRPYVGLGYSTHMGRDKKFKFSLDAGVLFFGGVPHVYVDNVYSVSPEKENTMLGDWKQDDDGEWYCEKRPTYRIDLTRDVEDIPGKTGRWVDVVKKFKCLPMLSVTFSHSLF